MSNEVASVKIVSNDIDAYGQIMGACISGMNACSKIHDRDHLDRFSAIHEWATNAHAKLALEACPADDPALG